MSLWNRKQNEEGKEVVGSLEGLLAGSDTVKSTPLYPHQAAVPTALSNNPASSSLPRHHAIIRSRELSLVLLPMDPLSIAASAVSLLGFVAKAVTSIAGFSRTARDANDDLDALIKELLLLRSLLEELARDFAASQRGFSVPDGLLRQVHTNISGCSMVVEQVVELVEKYQKDSAWTKSKWVLFGQGDVRKLKISVEAYKSAISIGMLIISK